MTSRYIAIICIGLSGCFLTQPKHEGTPTLEAVHSADPIELELSEQTKSIHKRLSAAGVEYEDRVVSEQAAELVSKLSLTVDGKLPTVRIIRDPKVNAFALYDGTICLNSGLVAKLRHPDQLAFVLAHEAAHWSQHHARTRYRTSANTLLMAQVLDTIVTPFASRFRLKGVAEQAIDNASVASFGVYSRQLERDADTRGVAAMMEAGFNPRHALTVLQIFERLGGSASSGFAASLLSDHPGAQDRMSALRSILEEQGVGELEAATEEDSSFIQKTAQIRLANAGWAAREGDFFGAIDDIELIEKAFPTSVRSEEWNRAQMVRALVYQGMARDIGFVKRTVSEDHWKQMYGDMSDQQVAIKFCRDARNNLQTIEKPQALMRTAKKQLSEMQCVNDR